MSCATHIPVCRLRYLIAATAPTCWRRAQAGTYGEVTRDDRGRQQVRLDVVEAVEGITFAPELIAAALGTPSRNIAHDRRKAEQLQQLSPGPIRIDAGPQNFFCKGEVEAFALGCVQRRDHEWRRFLMQTRKPYGR